MLQATAALGARQGSRVTQGFVRRDSVNALELPSHGRGREETGKPREPGLSILASAKCSAG